MIHRIDVLDKGFVALRNVAGPTRRIDGDFDPDGSFVPREFDADDRDPAQAARLSFEQGDFGSDAKERALEEDMRLNRYLLTNGHTSPFEMVQVWIEVKVPIFVDRQLVRHRTWRRNESSGRYVTLPSYWYVPETVAGKPSGGAKQGRSEDLDTDTQSWFKQILNWQCTLSYDLYQKALERGVAPEQARMFLHLNHYVHWLGNVDLHNLFHFLRLRTHSHAQWEARQYAEAIVELLRPHLPRLMGLFDEVVRRSE